MSSFLDTLRKPRIWILPIFDVVIAWLLTDWVLRSLGANLPVLAGLPISLLIGFVVHQMVGVNTEFDSWLLGKNVDDPGPPTDVIDR